MAIRSLGASLACAVLACGCGGPSAPSEEELHPLLRVLAVAPVYNESYDPDFDPFVIRGEVVVVLPDRCTAFGPHEEEWRGSEYHQTLRGARLRSCPADPNVAAVGIAIPGPLAPGEYAMIVNGVRGEVTVPAAARP